MTSLALSPLTGPEGEVIRLGSAIGRGGEGTVYDVAGRPTLAAKMMHEPMSAERAAKVEALARLRTEAIEAAAAWPIGLVRNHARAPVGLLMPRVAGHRELHELYSPRSRLTAFPSADSAFLLGVALNLARAFGVVHHLGCVIGDVNHASVLVSERGLVRLIDCDSFQVRDGGDLYTCDVGQALFTPPELQGQSLRGRERSADHDAFGLAVLVFQLLFMGRHPFAGRHLGRGEMPIERAIAERRFAYGPGAGGRDMAAPPNTLPLDVYGATPAGLFERSFAGKGARPSARDWVEALGAARRDVKPCLQNGRHAHHGGLSPCPFCAVEEATGAFLFGFGADQLKDRGLPMADKVAMAWTAVGKIVLAVDGAPDFSGAQARLTPPPPPPRRAPPDPEPGGALRGVAAIFMVGGVGAAMVGVLGSLGSDTGWAGLMLGGGAAFLLGMALNAASESAGQASAPPPPPPPPRPGILAVAAARKELQDLRQAWSKTEGWARDLESARREVADLMKQWERLPVRRRVMIEKLESKDHERQLNRYLNRFAIAGAELPGIGPTRTATLQSFGVWTAGDATEEALAAVPGFGPHWRGVIRGWRLDCAKGFKPGPAAPLDAADLAQIERVIGAEARALADEIAKAPCALETARRTIVAERRRIAARVAALGAPP